MSMPAACMPGMMPAGMGNMMMVPRCTMKMEKCAGGMKITCIVRRPMACSHDAEPLHDDGRRHVQLLHA